MLKFDNLLANRSIFLRYRKKTKVSTAIEQFNYNPCSVEILRLQDVWSYDIAGAGPMADLPPHGADPPERECCATKECNSYCPVWHELITSPAYQGPQGFQVPTMTGRKEPLLFRRNHQNGKEVIRVWRASGTLDFTFDEHDCRAICERFDAGLRQGRSFATGGTAYFNEKSWINRPLTIITAPFAAPVIRHARQNLGMPV